MNALAHTERDRLADCEQVIERGLQTFREVGTALAAIRDERLYREAYGTFEEYCRERWGLSETYAYDIIASAGTASAIAETGQEPPAKESQARELSRTPEPDRADVWRQANERTDGNPTARVIREVRQEREQPEPEPTPEPVPPAVSEPTPEPDHSEGDARRDAELEAVMAGTDTRFRANFARAMSRADDVWQFDIDRIAELHDYDHDLRPWLEEMTRWCEQVTQACKRKRSGLRVVEGGQQ